MRNKIVVCVRTRDEEARIGLFCKAYEHADMILVADGGSVDKTKEIAAQFPNVIIRDYPGRMKLAGDYWRNNDSDHANWLFRWAKEYSPDWIIYDDCDCRPNYVLRNYYRLIMESCRDDIIMAVRFYVWGLDQHFPNMPKPGINHDQFEPSLYAWRGHLDLWTINVPPAYDWKWNAVKIKDFHTDMKTLDLFPPLALIHYSWDDPDRVEQKIEYYRKSKFIEGMLHPLEFAGPLEPLPEYLFEY